MSLALHDERASLAGQSKISTKNVETTLKYWKKPDAGRTSIDLTDPGADRLCDELGSLEEEHPILIRDIRGQEETEQFTLDRNGFQYIEDLVPEYNEDWDEKRIERFFLPSTEDLVARLTGATKVLVYKHRVRCHATGPCSPAHIVHADFTPVGAMQQLKTLIPPSEHEQLVQSKTRILALNIWRPLQTVTRDPLALCDWASIDPEEDIIPSRFVAADGWLEVAKVAHSSRHSWWYCSFQSPEEVVVFKQFDSATGERGSSVVHSAFVDSEFVEEEPRRSLEVGVFAFVPQ
ncbi:hypothetical protein BJX64DRAFT_295925 [Aspergillus heterothallicus]